MVFGVIQTCSRFPGADARIGVHDQLTLPAPACRGNIDARVSVRRQDAIAGLVNAVVSVPDGLASAALAGVNPVYGL